MTSGGDLVVVDGPVGAHRPGHLLRPALPGLFRSLVDGGAEAFVIPAGWPERRVGHWQVLARARAIENQAYVLACNEAGTHGGVPIAGCSMVIDLQVKVLAEAGTGEEVLSVEIDPGLGRCLAWGLPGSRGSPVGLKRRGRLSGLSRSRSVHRLGLEVGDPAALEQLHQRRQACRPRPSGRWPAPSDAPSGSRPAYWVSLGRPAIWVPKSGDDVDVDRTVHVTCGVLAGVPHVDHPTGLGSGRQERVGGDVLDRAAQAASDEEQPANKAAVPSRMARSARSRRIPRRVYDPRPPPSGPLARGPPVRWSASSTPRSGTDGVEVRGRLSPLRDAPDAIIPAGRRRRTGGWTWASWPSRGCWARRTSPQDMDSDEGRVAWTGRALGCADLLSTRAAAPPGRPGACPNWPGSRVSRGQRPEPSSLTRRLGVVGSVGPGRTGAHRRRDGRRPRGPRSRMRSWPPTSARSPSGVARVPRPGHGSLTPSTIRARPGRAAHHATERSQQSSRSARCSPRGWSIQSVPRQGSEFRGVARGLRSRPPARPSATVVASATARSAARSGRRLAANHFAAATLPSVRYVLGRCARCSGPSATRRSSR